MWTIISERPQLLNLKLTPTMLQSKNTKPQDTHPAQDQDVLKPISPPSLLPEITCWIQDIQPPRSLAFVPPFFRAILAPTPVLHSLTTMHLRHRAFLTYSNLLQLTTTLVLPKTHSLSTRRLPPSFLRAASTGTNDSHTVCPSIAPASVAKGRTSVPQQRSSAKTPWLLSTNSKTPHAKPCTPVV